MCTNNKYYSISVHKYAKKHFIKSFSRKYKTWDATFIEIENMLSRVDMFLLTSKIEKIHNCDTWYIAKCEFKVVWTSESPKKSWNRIIIFVDEEKFETQILLLYAKTNIWSHNETIWWEQEIKNSHKDIAKLFSWL